MLQFKEECFSFKMDLLHHIARSKSVLLPSANREVVKHKSQGKVEIKNANMRKIERIICAMLIVKKGTNYCKYMQI